VVHGGGKQMTRYLADRGVESRFVHGLRVTTPEVVDAILKVFAGSVNHELVAAFVEAGALPVGLTGIDARLAEAERVSAELGQVGRPVRSRPDLLNLLTANGYLPVIACVAGNPAGEVFNVNADQMAVACAAALPADYLVFLTDVAAVKDASGAPIPRLTIEEARALISSGVATGGMEAKLNACIAALEQGVTQIAIASGAEPEAAARLLASKPLGTLLARS
jgi:acetylglutamate kinase